MKSIILLILGTITIAPVFSEFEGLCPTAEVDFVQNFNQTEFQGSWYVIERYNHKPSDRISCTRADYEWLEEYRRFIQGIMQKVRKYPQNPGIISTQYNRTFLIETENFSNNGKYEDELAVSENYQFVVDTDYINYVVLWICQQNLDTHEQNLIVMAREKFFDINSSESLNATLAKAPFDRSLLKPINHEDPICEDTVV